MVSSVRARVPSLFLGAFIGIVICTGSPGVAWSGPALYTGSVELRLWGGRAVPYGALLSSPNMQNSPSGDLVSLFGTGPASFGLSAGQLTLQTSLLDFSPTPTSVDFRRTSFSGANGTGSFFVGGAPGAGGFAPLPAIPASQFGVAFAGLPNRFGGVMNLLGDFDWDGVLANCSNCTFRTDIPLTAIGGAFGGTAQATAYINPSLGSTTRVTATVWGFPWDTGTVGAVAAIPGRTYSATATSAVGADLRTPSGLGTLQLVSPVVVQVRSHPPFCGGCENKWYYAGIARAEFRFVPEPEAGVLLLSGAAALSLLSHFAKRRKP